MNLYKLGEEYLEQSKKLRIRVREVAQMLQECEDPDECLLLKKRLYYLATESRDCLQTAEDLMNYYVREEENEQTYSA